MISHHDKCVFVHIPKCAGQSIELFFLQRLGLDWEKRAPLLLRPNDVPALGPPRLAHLKAQHYVEKKWMTPAQFTEYFKFTFVRDPWDRIASFYRFLGYDRRCSFASFVHHHLARQMEKKEWFLCPQADYIHGPDGKLLVDFVGRFESLAQDFSTACQRMSIYDARLSHVNNSSKRNPGFTRWFQRRSMPYRDMYDARTRDVVANMYKVDIEVFRYQF